LTDSLLPTIFWTEAVATGCYVLNRVLVTKPHDKTPYELLTRDKPFISYLKPFGCHVTILNTSDPLGKFDKKSNEGYIVGQEQAGKKEANQLGLAFPSLNLILGVGSALIGSFISAGYTPPVFAGSTPQMSSCASPISADRHFISVGKCHVSAGRPSGSAARTPVPAGRILGKLTSNTSSERFPRASSMENLDIHDGLKIFDYPKSGIFNYSSYDEEFSGPDANNLESSLDAIGTKWILKNKRDARGIVCRNKARLVAQGRRQEEGIDYTDDFAPVARIEAIRLFLAFASFIGFRVYQMDVKSAFLYGKIAEEVYVTQPRGFEDPDHLKEVYKVVKALYGLHQALRAWYERLSTFLLKHRYRRGTIDKTLFIKKYSKYIMLVQVYIEDIIFGSTRKDWCEEFETLMQSEFQMSSMEPFTFFLGLQVDQRPDGIFIHQEQYVADILKKFDLDNSKLASTPFEPQKIREKNVPDEPISVHLYRSMIGCLMYLTATRPDIMFACKKQTIVATSSCEAEYVAVASCCGQGNIVYLVHENA
nr:retrovirus-related Pol polyprotein from transposon TNT 1-94 [Tanacetum cinerariifolium]